MGHRIIVIPGVHVRGDAQLLVVVHTDGALRPVLGAGERREKEARENCNDRDYHKKLDEREAGRVGASFHEVR